MSLVPPLPPALADANPQFALLHRDLCTTKLNLDGSSVVVDAKVLGERERLSEVRVVLSFSRMKWEWDVGKELRADTLLALKSAI